MDRPWTSFFESPGTSSLFTITKPESKEEGMLGGLMKSLGLFKETSKPLLKATVFPSSLLDISTLSFYIMRANPVSAEKTRVEFEVYNTRNDSHPTPDSLPIPAYSPYPFIWQLENIVGSWRELELRKGMEINAAGYATEDEGDPIVAEICGLKKEMQW